MDAETREMFLRAMVVLPVISASLKMQGFGATQKFLLRSMPTARQTSQKNSIHIAGDLKRTELTSRMVNAAIRHVWRASTCLEKSLALWWLLGRQGVPSQLRIGARKFEGKFEAHAWVERGGAALSEPSQEHRHYATFDAAFPPHTSETL
jgi:transglutaminase superfamily protein